MSLKDNKKRVPKYMICFSSKVIDELLVIISLYPDQNICIVRELLTIQSCCTGPCIHCSGPENEKSKKCAEIR